MASNKLCETCNAKSAGEIFGLPAVEHESHCPRCPKGVAGDLKFGPRAKLVPVRIDREYTQETPR